MRRWTSLLAPLLLAGCLAPPQHGDLAAPVPRFDPLAFFEGASSGKGELTIIFRDPQAVTVASTGRRAEDGSLVLDQTIRREGKADKQRQWVMREIAPGRYAGTLTEAEGPVEIASDGNRLTIRYHAKTGEAVEQFLYLSDDGTRAQNYMTFHKYGITAAIMREVITRAP